MPAEVVDLAAYRRRVTGNRHALQLVAGQNARPSWPAGIRRGRTSPAQRMARRADLRLVHLGRVSGWARRPAPAELFRRDAA